MSKAVQVPDGWINRQLLSVCDFSQGVQVDLEKQVAVPQNGFEPFLRIENYTQNSDDLRYVEDLFDTKKHVTEEDALRNIDRRQRFGSHWGNIQTRIQSQDVDCIQGMP